MDIKYATALMKAYEDVYDSLAVIFDSVDWPVCANPDQRRKEFLELLALLPDNDAWAIFYRTLAENVDSVMWLKKPKDKTKNG